MSAEPERPDDDDPAEEMAAADEANGEGQPVNDAEARYGEDESPA